MGIKKIDDNKYEIRFKHNGDEVKKVFYGTKAQANYILAQFKEDIAKAKAENHAWTGMAKLKGKPKTFEEVAVSYVLSLATTKPNTLDVYEALLRLHIIPALGALPIRSIDQGCVEKFRASLVNKPSVGHGSKGKPLASATVNVILKLTSAILHFAERTSEIDKAPHLKALPQERVDIDPLSKEELQTVLLTAQPFWKPVFQLLASTGVRIGELCALTWSDIDLQKNEIRITKQLSKNVIVKPKTASSVRTVTILPQAKEALLELKNRGMFSITGMVVVTKIGKTLSPSKTYDAWMKALTTANIRQRPLHQLRHTYASLLLQANVPPGLVAAQLGHSNMGVTFKHYFKYLPSNNSLDLLAASNALGDSPTTTPNLVKDVQ